MKPVTLNLATRPFRNNTVVGATLVGASVLLVAATALNLFVFFNHGSAYAQLQRDQQSDRVRLDGLQQEERGLLKDIKTRDFKRIYGRGQFAQELILKRAFSWTLLFNTLEKVAPASVMTTAIRPNVTANGIVVRVEGVAKNHGALIRFEERLLGHRSFSRVFPSSERRLNPRRPEISFILNFDYVPQPDRPEEAVAEGPAPQPPPVDSAQGAAQEPPEQVVTAATKGPVTPAGASNRDAGRDAPGRPTGVPVGRDGYARSTEVLARLVVAPGGVYDPAAAERTMEPVDDPPTRRQPAARPQKTTAPRGAKKEAAERGPARRPPAGEPNLARAGSGTIRAARAASPAGSRTAKPAERLDIQLNFKSRPVAEIYRALAEAHGVQFEIDAAVDQDLEITTNLSGRNLPDAIALLAGAARHRVTRARKGVYRVAGSAGGAPIRDAAIREEDLAPPKEPGR